MTKRKELDQETEDLRAILATDYGRRFLWAELSRRNVFKTAFHPEIAIFAHNEGLRSAGVGLMQQIIDADPHAWIVMQQEAAQADA